MELSLGAAFCLPSARSVLSFSATQINEKWGSGMFQNIGF